MIKTFKLLQFFFFIVVTNLKKPHVFQIFLVYISLHFLSLFFFIKYFQYHFSVVVTIVKKENKINQILA